MKLCRVPDPEPRLITSNGSLMTRYCVGTTCYYCRGAESSLGREISSNDCLDFKISDGPASTIWQNISRLALEIFQKAKIYIKKIKNADVYKSIYV